MRTQFRNELHDINATVLTLIDQAQVDLRDSVAALLARDKVAAKGIRARMQEFDDAAHDLEVRIYELLVTQSPRARDLRFLQTTLYIGFHLERIASHTYSINKTTKRIGDLEIPQSLAELIRAESNLVLRVYGEMRRAYAERDILAVRQLPGLDEPVNSLYKQFFRESARLEESDDFQTYTHLILVSRYLERIADHATDIGERLLFLFTGHRMNYEQLEGVNDEAILSLVDEQVVVGYREGEHGAESSEAPKPADDGAPAADEPAE